MLPRFGWEAMFFAAAVPLLLLPVILWYLPESVGFPVRRAEVSRRGRCWPRSTWAASRALPTSW